MVPTIQESSPSIAAWVRLRHQILEGFQLISAGFASNKRRRMRRDRHAAQGRSRQAYAIQSSDGKLGRCTCEKSLGSNGKKVGPLHFDKGNRCEPWGKGRGNVPSESRRGRGIRELGPHASKHTSYEPAGSCCGRISAISDSLDDRCRRNRITQGPCCPVRRQVPCIKPSPSYVPT